MKMYAKQAGLMAGASMLALGLAAMPAKAFESVNWTWDANVTETVTKEINIGAELTPTGMVMLEDMQVSVGDVTANSVVDGINNTQPTGPSEGGSSDVDLGSITLESEYANPGDGGENNLVEPDSVTSDGGDVALDAELVGGTIDEANTEAGNDGTVTATVDLGSVTVEQEPGEALTFDAMAELPEVVSAATAVGNNTSVDADTAVQLHEMQVAVGEGTTMGEDGEPMLEDATLANISATSTVSNILNGSVDSTATAVGNNLTGDVVAEGADRLLMADATQFSLANVSATSDVSAVNVENYTNLGGMDRPLVNSAATAVGNNKSISVNGPDVDTDIQP
jgi:hypothetical protein